MQKIVTIGGGTGNYVVLSGLKRLKDVEITAVVPATDSGGSTGRLRDEFGYLPSGDIRQCLVALAEDKEEQHLLRELFSYRFSKGESGLKGHNFGNLFLTALTDILGNDLEAIKAAEKILNTRGNVLPVTTANVQLVAEYENGKRVVGEGAIDEPEYPHDGRMRITNLWVEPATARILPEVKAKIEEADVIVFTPGDLYTSLLAIVTTPGFKEAIAATKELNPNLKLVALVNLMTKFGQTTEFTATDQVVEIEKYLNTSLDYLLLNNSPLPQNILHRYTQVNTYPIKDDLAEDHRAIRADLLATEEVKSKSGDTLFRSLIRHDGDKIAKQIAQLL